MLVLSMVSALNTLSGYMYYECKNLGGLCEHGKGDPEG
jgi:hypothetical protein